MFHNLLLAGLGELAALELILIAGTNFGGVTAGSVHEPGTPVLLFTLTLRSTSTTFRFVSFRFVSFRGERGKDKEGERERERERERNNKNKYKCSVSPWVIRESGFHQKQKTKLKE